VSDKRMNEVASVLRRVQSFADEVNAQMPKCPKCGRLTGGVKIRGIEFCNCKLLKEDTTDDAH
jgi:hypothetical protein